MPGNKANQPQQQKVSNREHCIICCPCIPLAVLALAAASPLPPACSTKSVMKEDNFGNGIVVIRVVGLDGEGFTLRLALTLELSYAFMRCLLLLACVLDRCVTRIESPTPGRCLSPQDF